MIHNNSQKVKQKYDLNMISNNLLAVGLLPRTYSSLQPSFPYQHSNCFGYSFLTLSHLEFKIVLFDENDSPKMIDERPKI